MRFLPENGERQEWFRLDNVNLLVHHAQPRLVIVNRYSSTTLLVMSMAFSQIQHPPAQPGEEIKSGAGEARSIRTDGTPQ